MILSCRDVSFSYALGRQHIPALRGVSLAINKAEFVCFTGPSGSGKSTLLNILGLIEPVQGGEVLFEGRNLAQLSERERNALRRYKLGFVFQSFHLIEVLSAAENVEFFLARQGILRAERDKRVEESLRAVGLWDFRHQRPGELSGGQRQRVAVARALAKRPDIVIADEPTASLDQDNGRQVMQLLRQMSEERGVTVLVSSHDPMVQSFATRQYRLMDGKLC